MMLANGRGLIVEIPILGPIGWRRGVRVRAGCRPIEPIRKKAESSSNRAVRLIENRHTSRLSHVEVGILLQKHFDWELTQVGDKNVRGVR